VEKEGGFVNVPGTTPVASTPARGEAPDRRSVEEVAREFEAMLLAQMLRQLRETLAATEEDEEAGPGLGLGDQTMTEIIDVELARQLSAAGGIGLAKELQRSMMRTLTPGTAAPAQPAPAETESPSGPVVASTPARAPDPAAPLRLLLDAPQSSAFGWRTDPFHGTRRFHAGIDLKAAYGREVPAAGAGQVAFAGEQGGYGLTVVLTHPNGTQTRYAHLSSLSVRAGEEVAQGTVVGRVGNSGRSTGPHLHFEVLVAGRPVDPDQALAAGLAGLKLRGEVDD
jgi:murein DD-endopeptidase MepM/ murein hydrolase activator NlpD